AFVNLGAPASGVATGQFALHPGPAAFGDLAILRFTAPTAGDYLVSGQFFAGDVGSMSGLIILNDDAAHPLQSFNDTSDASIFAPLTVSLATGAHLDFVVANNGNYLFGSTPLSVQISAVPEPSHYLLMLGGLGLLACVNRRRSSASIEKAYPETSGELP
ncbi:MAG TPA: PEP-CTERM sorting domain-containing protein, partial [Burkholderiaceae bacterium]